MTTQFFEAIKAAEVDRIRRMLASDKSLARARDEHGATALHHAAFEGNRELVELLLENGADINARDARYDATPGGWALHYLRERGALLAIEIEDALHAIRMRDIVWARRLVTRHPALRNAVDAEGKRLAAHANGGGVPELVSLFDS
jgi:ankyrin repeat protein